MSQFININDDSPNIRIDSVRALVDAAYHQVLTPPGGEVIRRVYKQQNELKDRRTTDPRLSKMSTAAFNDVLVRLVERNRPQLLAEMATTMAGVLLAMLPDALLSPGPDLQKRCKTTGNAASNGRAKGVKHGIAQLLACAASEGVKQSAVNTNSGTSDAAADAAAASAAPAVSLQAIQTVSQRVTESGAVSGVMVGKMGKMAADVDRPRRIARIDNCLSYIPAIQTGVARSLMFRVLQEKDKVKPELVITDGGEWWQHNRSSKSVVDADNEVDNDGDNDGDTGDDAGDAGGAIDSMLRSMIEGEFGGRIGVQSLTYIRLFVRGPVTPKSLGVKSLVLHDVMPLLRRLSLDSANPALKALKKDRVAWKIAVDLQTLPSGKSKDAREAIAEAADKLVSLPTFTLATYLEAVWNLATVGKEAGMAPLMAIVSVMLQRLHDRIHFNRSDKARLQEEAELHVSMRSAAAATKRAPVQGLK
jgi:hypothetical protein